MLMEVALRCVAYKSFTTLINTSYSMKNTEGENSRDSGLLSNPLSFLRSGYFYWDRAELFDRGSGGNCWSSRSTSTTTSNFLHFSNTYLYPQLSNNDGYGFAVRCIALSGKVSFFGDVRRLRPRMKVRFARNDGPKRHRSPKKTDDRSKP